MSRLRVILYYYCITPGIIQDADQHVSKIATHLMGVTNIAKRNNIRSIMGILRVILSVLSLPPTIKRATVTIAEQKIRIMKHANPSSERESSEEESRLLSSNNISRGENVWLFYLVNLTVIQQYDTEEFYCYSSVVFFFCVRASRLSFNPSYNSVRI